MSTKIQPPQINSASFSLSSQSPSFSSENIADIAARVVKELNLSSSDPFDDDFYSNDTVEVKQSQPSDHNNVDDDENNDGNNGDDNDDDEEESEFEFAILNSSPISADEIFSNGQIKPMFPIFNTDLVYAHQNNAVRPQTLRLPLRKLLQENNSTRNGTVSSSSSEADELEGVPPGTYCVWTPKKKEEVVQMRKKSKSTGFPSKRWRFKDLLHRSNSDGKDTFVFLTPAASKVNSNGNGDGKRREKSTVVRKGGMDGKKKSYLPYRQDLVGFFANVNGISRTVRPF